MKFYEHSGRGGTWGVPLAALAGIGTAAVLAVAYIYIAVVIPFIKVIVFATAGFGFGVGAATAWGAKVGKIRNVMIATSVGVLVGVLAVYFAWAFDPPIRFPQQFDAPVWRLDMIWRYIQFGLANGFWSFNQNGAPVTGPILAMVWMGEAAFIVAISAFTVKLSIGIQPFCEETNRWTTCEKSIAQLSLENDDQIDAKVQQLLNGNIDIVRQFARGSMFGNHLELDIATCADCPTCNFLTVRKILFSTNNQGKVTKNETKLLVNLQISKEDLQTVRSAGIDIPVETAKVQNKGSERERVEST